MEKKRILLIDDDDFVRTLIFKKLGHLGYEVAEATDGLAGMDMIDEGFIPDMVITDIVMPNKDGLEIILEIRKKCPNTKVVTISGNGYGWGGDYLDMSKKLGSDAVFPKPLDMALFEEAIGNLLGSDAAASANNNF